MSRQPSVVVFGAGKVACGLLGRLLWQSGYRIVFVARRPEVIDAIEHRGGYAVNLLGDGGVKFDVTSCRALSIFDCRRVIDAVTESDVVFTAVGIDNLGAIAPIIAAGLWHRSRVDGRANLNIVACENLPGAGAYLRHQIVSSADFESAMVVDEVGGFSAALTRQIMTGGEVKERRMTFNVEGSSDLVVDRSGLKPPLPEVRRTLITDEFNVMVMRKLFTLNCAHAVAAYLGYRQGCEYIHEAAAHPRIAPILIGALNEAAGALKAEFPHHAAAIEIEVAESLAQISEPRLADPVVRVARGPRRKLSPRERLVGPAKLAARHHLPNDHLCHAIAAALTYDYDKDPEAVAMQQAIADQGLAQVITEDCGLLPHEDLAQAVKHQWHQLTRTAASGREMFVGGAATLEKIRSNVARDLAAKYNPQLVDRVVDRVTERFQEARVWSFVEILMKRAALQELAMEAR